MYLHAEYWHNKWNFIYQCTLMRAEWQILAVSPSPLAQLQGLLKQQELGRYLRRAT
jgi:hypothetical protein